MRNQYPIHQKRHTDQQYRLASNLAGELELARETRYRRALVMPERIVSKRK